MELPKTTVWLLSKILGCRDTVMQACLLQEELTPKLDMCQSRDRYQIKKISRILLPQLPRVL